MIEQNAVVIGLTDNLAILEIERRTACGLCGQKRGCGNATWGKLLGHKSQSLTAENKIDAKVGASVVVGIDEKVFLRTVFYLYIMPLLGMFLGAVFADVFLDNELYVLLSAFSGLILGFLFVKRYLGDKMNVATMKRYAVVLRHADDICESENDKVANCKSVVNQDINNVVKFQTKRGE
jgi:sigma-E factor negative regulatory protein RseC